MNKLFKTALIAILAIFTSSCSGLKSFNYSFFTEKGRNMSIEQAMQMTGHTSNRVCVKTSFLEKSTEIVDGKVVFRDTTFYVKIVIRKDDSLFIDDINDIKTIIKVHFEKDGVKCIFVLKKGEEGYYFSKTKPTIEVRGKTFTANDVAKFKLKIDLDALHSKSKNPGSE